MADGKRMVDFLPGNGTPTIARKIGRNDLCPCKSGKKVKNCCKLETKFYHSSKSKFDLEEEKRMAELLAKKSIDELLIEGMQ